MTPVTRQQLNRWLVGILAAVCLVCGMLIGLLDSMDNLWCGSFVRSGLLLGAFWIGMPTKGRAAAWADVSPLHLIATCGVIVLMMRVVRRPYLLIPLAAVLFVLTVVWPMVTGQRRKR